MKKFVIALSVLFSLAAFAKPEYIVFPSVYNFGQNVQVQIWNTTDRFITCSGSLTLTLESGERENQSFFEPVSPRFSSFRTIYPRTNSRIVFVNHSIFCN